jgi:hypothetical protein
MAGRKAAPKPAEPKLTKRQRNRSQVEYENVAAVNYNKMEKDVVRLIDCLTEWTRDLQATRSKAAVPPRTKRSTPRGRRVVSATLPGPRYPRGEALTEPMRFTDRNGAVWLAYIEGGRRPQRRQRRRATVLPDRHLRFDGATESRFTSLVPAGSPFLGEARLRSLLEDSHPDLPSLLGTAAPAPRQRVSRWSTRAVKSGREVMGDSYRWWREGASQREARRRRFVELLSGAADRVHGMMNNLLGDRPA